jgi:eukaryotic-like serine/threonine-protein kinase
MKPPLQADSGKGSQILETDRNLLPGAKRVRGMAEASAHATANGLVLGRYRPLRPLGSGGMGSVWHAHDEKRDRGVALKIVPRTGTAGPRAEREATAAAQLRHPACLRAYSLARDEGHVYIAYEYVPGRTLRHALDNGELDDERAVEAAAQILEGLAHAHERGIVHRDVKPSNVLLVDGPGISVRLLDFGLALMTEEETLTAAGDVPGTLAYISPERLSGKPADPATDVWSTGVLLWEALAHRHPFGGGRFLEVAKQIGRGAPSLGSVRPDLPRAFVQLVDKALSVEPAKRPPAERLAASLRRAFHTRDRHRSVSVPSLPRTLPDLGLARRIAPALPAALLVAWTTATLPFFPAHWPALLAVVAALLTFAGPRLGFVFALAVPVLPLGNIALGLAIAYGVAACAWFALFWAVPRAGLLFVAGPLLAPLGALGLVPLATLPAGGPARRAVQAGAALLAAFAVAALGGHSLPLVGGHVAELSIAGVPGPLDAISSLWGTLRESHGLLPETLALAAAAAAVGSFRHRGPWGATAFASLLLTLTLLVAPAATALPLVGAAWVSALLLALEPGPRRPPPSILGRLPRIPLRRPRLRAVTGS